ncbi:MAG: stalk domain-containing protein [Peptococcaceae bacterium]
MDQSGPGSDVPAGIRNGWIQIPLRYVAENLGARVIWHPAGQVVEIAK